MIKNLAPPSDAVTGLTPRCRNSFFPYKEDFARDLSDCLVSRSKPWRLEIWEPLHTTAPGPAKAQAYCCYIQTVIFYTPGTCDKLDQIETRLAWDDIVSFDGDDFEIGGGTVIWADDRWWMQRWARRIDG